MVKKIFKIIGFVILIVIAFIWYQSFIIDTINDVKIENKLINISIPFKMEHDRIIINANVNGENKQFLVDTGASTSSVFSVEHETSLFSNYLIGLDINNSIFLTRVIKIANFQIGTLHINDAYFRTIKKKNDNFDGIIGNNILKNFSCNFNFDNKTITFSNFNKQIKEPDTMLVVLKNNKVYVKGYNNISYIIDTGANTVVSMNKIKFKSHRLDIVKGNMLKGLNSASNTPEYISEIQNFNLGWLIVPKVEVYTSSKSKNIIGTRFLKNYNFTLDYINKKLSLIPRANQSFILNDFGFRVSNTGNIDYVISNSIADEKGVEVTDKIIKINDSVFDSKKHLDLSLYKNIKIEFLTREDKSKTISLERKEKLKN